MQPKRPAIESYLGRLYGYALSLCGDSDSAHDLVQSTVVKALSAKNTPTEEAPYRAWLFKILHNAHVDQTRRAGRLRPATEEELGAAGEGNNGWPSDVYSLEQGFINQFAVREGLARLGGAQREILVLIDAAGLSYQETADLLQVPIGTVMSRVSRARKQLLGALSESKVRSITRKVARRSR